MVKTVAENLENIKDLMVLWVLVQASTWAGIMYFLARISAHLKGEE